jgi:hypothetical protein
MIDEQEVREVSSLIGICVFGAFALSAIVIILGLAGERTSPPTQTTNATSTTQ